MAQPARKASQLSDLPLPLSYDTAFPTILRVAHLTARQAALVSQPRAPTGSLARPARQQYGSAAGAASRLG
jgi:hypothetical protein